MNIRFFGILLILVSSMVALALGCQNDDDDDTILDDYPGGIGGLDSGDDDDDTADDDTIDDDTSDDDTADDDDDDRINLLIIHDNVDYLTDYADILYYYGIDSFEMPEDYVTIGDFTDIDVILIDTSTTWYDADAVDRMAGVDLPMLGVFYGGGILFDNLGYTVGWTGGEIDLFSTSIDVVNSTHSIYTKPNNLGVADGDRLTLFSPSLQLLYHDFLPAPAGATMLAERILGSDYAAIVKENKAIYWGFEMTPSSLTNTGALLLVNCIHYLNKL
ncbi:MAG TPA: hypothetical protein PK961_09360 [bacterium]|nr:hypothetical protein [bacterium]